MTNWTDEEILQAIRDWSTEHGKVPGYQDMNGTQGEGRPGASTAQKRFGTWTAAVRAAGLEPRVGGCQPEQRKSRLRCDRCGELTSLTAPDSKDQGVMCRPCRHQWERDGCKPPRFSDERCVARLREWADANPECNIERAKVEIRNPGVNCVVDRLGDGSWFQALATAGIVHPLSDEGILAALRRWAKHRDHLTATAWQSDGQRPHGDTIAKRFGGWNAALGAAGLPLPTGQGLRGESRWRHNRGRTRRMVTGGVRGASQPMPADPNSEVEHLSPRPKRRGGWNP